MRHFCLTLHLTFLAILVSLQLPLFAYTIGFSLYTCMQIVMLLKAILMYTEDENMLYRLKLTLQFLRPLFLLFPVILCTGVGIYGSDLSFYSICIVWYLTFCISWCVYVYKMPFATCFLPSLTVSPLFLWELPSVFLCCHIEQSSSF